jgi:23S rRNA pseudouridine1911/1915/1917 synthase
VIPAEPAGDDEAEAFETRECVLDASLHGLRLDKALVALAPEFSRSHLQHLLGLGHVRLDGRPVAQAAKRVQAGQRLALALVPTDESRAYRPETMPLDIVFEDEHLLVLDKPAGRVVHPAPGNWSATLLNGLLAHHAGAYELPRAGIVHRLDKDTSGLMLVGKTRVAVTALVRMIAAREVHRRYVAIAWGKVEPESFSVDAPIGRDPRSRLRMAVVAGGKPARTDVLRIGLGQAESGRAVSVLRCTLHSGRTHQIRVHLAQRGHALVADALYGGEPELGLVRQALHAELLELPHPVLSTPLSFSRPPPADLAAALTRLGIDLRA